nr:hypothetical protein B11C_100034 [Bartonella sp. 1-1C]
MICLVIKSKDKFTLWLIIQVMQPEIINPINIILEHTSFNNPHKILKASYDICIGFFIFQSYRDRIFGFRCPY